eukprot:GHVL01032226.1.p1 GENE.GHVL01032226.1~~GHVL01032226.1.p1  ORF type:complete len:178 (+),score=30.45 GHVL01032226.1:336-869(+)
MHFSPSRLGCEIKLSQNNYAAKRKRKDLINWTDTIAFIQEPLNSYSGMLPKFTVRILEIENAWGGLTIGVSPICPSAIKDVAEDIETSSWYINADGWVIQPLEESYMTGWNPSSLGEHDSVSLSITCDGDLQVFVNNILKVDCHTKIPFFTDGLPHQFWGFVALTGTVSSLVLTNEV